MDNHTTHEPQSLLSEETLNMHRTVVSVTEELDAVDWYQQRADACTDDELKAILIHNMEEEIEHAFMVLEWMRRRSTKIDEMAKRYLFTEGSIVGIEGDDEGEGSRIENRSLNLGSLKKKETA